MRAQPAVWLSTLVATSILAVGSACSSERPGDYVFLESDGAVMPVWTRGELASGTFVVHVHGGPGNSSIALAEAGVFRPLESDAALVYWDQRGAGAAQGNASADSLTLDQYAADLGEVVTLIEERHPVDELVLMAHGFGVNVAAEYLRRSDHQQRVDAWVFVAGNFDMPVSIGMSHNWMVGFLDAQIEADRQSERWREMRTWYRDHPVIESGEQYRKHRRHLREANAYHKPGRFDRRGAARTLESPSDPIAEHIDRNRTRRLLWDRRSIRTLDVTEHLGAITVPTLLVWGKDDGVTPVAMSERALEALGTKTSAKQRVVLPDSAHRPALDQNRRFVREVGAFVHSRR